MKKTPRSTYLSSLQSALASLEVGEPKTAATILWGYHMVTSYNRDREFLLAAHRACYNESPQSVMQTLKTEITQAQSR